MKRTAALGLAVALAYGLSAGTLRAADEGDKQLAQAALAFFKKNCAECHHGAKPKSEVEDYDVLSHASLTKKRIDDDKKPFFYVSPKDPKKSLIWEKVDEGIMPPKDAKARPTDKEKALLKKWIEAGAPAFPAAPKKGEKGARKAAPANPAGAARGLLQ